MTDEQILKIAREACRPFPWGTGTTREIFLDAVRAVLAAGASSGDAVIPKTTLNYDGTVDITCAHCGGNGCFACLKAAKESVSLTDEQKAALDLAVLNLKTHGDDQLLTAIKPLLEFYESRRAAGASEGQTDFEWPKLPKLPRSPYAAGYASLFTEHQMQGYANAYGEAVRIKLSAEIAALRERIAGMEKDAGPRHWNPVYNTDPVQRACGELPEGIEIEIQLERDSGTVYLVDNNCGERHMIDDADTFNWTVHKAIDAAIAKEEPK